MTDQIVLAIATLFLRVRDNEKHIAVADKTLERYEKTEREVTDLKVLAARIDERLAHLPTQADLDKLHDRISKNGGATANVQREVAALAESVRGVRSGVDRLHAAELKRDAK